MSKELYLPIVGVMCGGSKSFAKFASVASQKHAPIELGHAIADLGWNLLTGGGNGAMKAVTQAYHKAPNGHGSGKSLAVLPRDKTNVAGADYAIETPLPGTKPDPEGYLVSNSRNLINVRLADVVVALPGGPGTLSELTLAFQLGKPCIAFLRDITQDRIGDKKTDTTVLKKRGIPVADKIADVEAFLQTNQPKPLQRVKLP